MCLRTKHIFTATQAKVTETGSVVIALGRTYSKHRKVTYAQKMLTAKLERKTQPMIKAHVTV
jgi:hypothetical protein